MEGANHAGQCVNPLWVKRMLDSCNALGLERLDSLGDLVTEFDAADALIAALDAGRLTLDFDLEPDAPDAGGLDG